MKVQKESLVGTLECIGVKGLVNELVIEANGDIAVSSNNEIIVVGNTKDFKFGERIALTNLGLLNKIVGSMEGDIQIEKTEVEGKGKIEVIGQEAKYAFRLADPKAVESLVEDKDKILGLKEKLTGVKLNIDVVRKVRKAISNLSATLVSIFVEDGKLNMVVLDEVTYSTAVIDICPYKDAAFKQDFNAKILGSVLDLISENGAMMFVGNKAPLFIDLVDREFVFMMSYRV